MWTNYQLPFEVKHQAPPLFSKGRDAYLRLHFSDGISLRSVEPTFKALLTPFVVLTETGALAGAGIAPNQCALSVSPRVGGRGLMWLLHKPKLDDAAIAVLINLLLLEAEACGLRSVEIGNVDRDDPLQPLHVSADNPYPKRFKQIGFPVVIDDDAVASREITIHFKTNLTMEAKRSVEGHLADWAAVTMIGAYGIAPIPPASALILPDRSFLWEGSTLNWHIDKYRAHPASLDGLINVCGALDYVHPITQLYID